MNHHIWTASGTDITLRWKKAGWVPPSEIQAYKDKWKYFQELPLRSLDAQGKIEYEGTLKLNKIFRIK